MLIPKISIEGDYLDSFLYKGRLYLFNRDKSVSIIKWDALIESIDDSPYSSLAFRCAFTSSFYLYSQVFSRIFNDKEFKDALVNKFTSIVDKFISKTDLEKFLLSKQDVPLDELPIDIDITIDTILASTTSGLHAIEANKPIKNKKHIANRSIKIHDSRIVCIRTGDYGRLLCSAGSDGLFEFETLPFAHAKYYTDPQMVYESEGCHSNSCNWMGMSYTSESKYDNFLRVKSWDKDSNKPVAEDNISLNEMFENSPIRIASSGDKIYSIGRSGISSIKYKDYSKNNDLDDRISNSLSIYEFEYEIDKVIDTKVTHFGLAIELDKKILVLSDDDTIALDGQAINFRSFPRSKNYLNQLHVIYDDRLEITSFNSDYFANQTAKKFGATVTKKLIQNSYSKDDYNQKNNK